VVFCVSLDFCISLDYFIPVLLAFVMLVLVSSQYQAKRLARKNASEMTYSVSSGTQNLNSVN